MPTTPTSSDLTRRQLEELDALLQRMLAGSSVAKEDKKPLELPAQPKLPLPPEEPVVLTARVPFPSPLPTALPHRETVVDQQTERIETAQTRRELPDPPVLINRFPIPELPPKPQPNLNWLQAPNPGASPPLMATPASVPVTPAVAYEPPAIKLSAAVIPTQAEMVLPPLGRIDPVPLSPPPRTEPIEAPVSLRPQPAQAEPPASESAGVPVLLWPVFAINWIAEGLLKIFGGEALLAPNAKTAIGWAGIFLCLFAAIWTAYGFGYLIPLK